MWGAEGIHGELLKVDIKIATATIQKYMRLERPPRATCQTWSAFLNNHAKEIWTCDFLPVIDLFLRQPLLYRRTCFPANRSL